jgi:uncharacterized protein YbaP (TraB family)
MKTGRLVSFSLAILLASLATATAQKPSTANATRHSLWKAEGKRCSVYLLGSIHVLKAGDYPLPAPIESAFSNAPVVVFETDIGAMEKPDAQMQIMSKAMLPEGQSLQEQLSPALYTRFTNQLQEAGLPALMVERFKPAIAALTLEVMELQKLGYDPEYGLDKHFYALAEKAGKQVVPLETIEFQIRLLTDLSKEEGEMVMKSTLDDLDTTKKDVQDLLKAWQTGDANGLEKMLNEAAHDAPAVFKRLVSDRNQRWVPKIEEWLQGDKNVIVIVGAGHLVGKDGVVELLRKKGSKVVQQ